ncbi:hypothetical protein FGE05_22045 [Pseudomonas sp. ICMP22404]|nr:hypothetical protein FGE05_22045 [Pseudomonas sp. ICMP22404]
MAGAVMRSPVGASLLAIAVDQSTTLSPDMPPSRAGSLPQGLLSTSQAVRKSPAHLYERGFYVCL